MTEKLSCPAVMIRYREIHSVSNYHFFFSRQYYGPKHASYQRHTHDFYEFFIVESGNVIHQINGNQEILRPGDLRFILPSDTHQLIPEDGGEFFIFNCNIEKELFQNCFQLLTGGELSPDDLLHITHMQEDEYRELLKKMKKLIFYSDPTNIFQTRLSGRFLIIHILKRFLERHDGMNSRPPWLENLCAQMQKPDNFRSGVRRLFELADYTQGHVSRSIKKYLGITPRQLVLEYKLQSVSRDLIYTKLSIDQIALQNGFHNYAYFNKVFIKKFECTPLHFRKKYIVEADHDKSFPA